MGHKEVEELLQATLDEEHDADKDLTQAALAFVNEEALGER
jgi:ferritin-like metal-binding protein YciE